MRVFLVSTDAGLEPVTRDEILELIPQARVSLAPHGAAGRLRVETDDAAPLLALRTAHHVDELRAEGPIASADEARAIVMRAELDEMRASSAFRVSSQIRGDVEVDRIALQRAAGAVLCERFGTRVDLEQFDLDVRADVLGRTLVVGPRLNRSPLADRIRRGRAVRSSLKATTAAALLRLVGAHRGCGRLIDPMCGAGTIALEAWRANPSLEIESADWDEQTVEVARGTFANHDAELEATLADARTLGQRCPGAYDWIVTDPPYGMRQARHASLGELYRRLLASFRDALRPDGTIAVVVVKHRMFMAAVDDSGLHVRRRIGIDAGSVELQVFVLAAQPGESSAPRQP